MCKIIAIANQKGGQSKSTTAVNLAVGLARNGKRVAVVDADPQGSCTASLGYKEPDELEITLATILGHIIDSSQLTEDQIVLSTANFSFAFQLFPRWYSIFSL